MTIDLWMSFLMISALFVLVPGPSTVLLVTSALNYGSRSGLATMPGVVAGVLFAMLASLGVTQHTGILSQTPLLLLKCGGVAVLVFIAVKTWYSAAAKTSAGPAVARDTLSRLFRSSFIISVVNPKWLVFYLAVAPEFLSSDATSALDTSIIVATFLGLVAIASGAWVFGASLLQPVVSTATRMTLVNRASALMMLALSAGIAANIMA